MICPFVILIDTAEQQPFGFTGIRSDAAHGNAEYQVNCRSFCLGRHPHSKGDYSIYGHVGRVGVERKSKDDAYSTFLGWDGHRERFERELENLSAMFTHTSDRNIVRCDNRIRTVYAHTNSNTVLCQVNIISFHIATVLKAFM